MPRSPLQLISLLILATSCSSYEEVNLVEAPRGRPLPADWVLVYTQDFDNTEVLEEFDFSDPYAWGWNRGDDAIGFEEGSSYAPPHRSPLAMGLLRDLEVRDFVLEAEVRQNGREYGHRDLCFFFGFEAVDRFYYTHLASAPDDRAHNVFVVDRADRTAVAEVAEVGVDWGEDRWHTVRIERQLSNGLIRIYFDDLEEAIIETRHRRFDWGRLGFGSFDDSGEIRRLRIWAPAVRRGRTLNPFEQP